MLVHKRQILHCSHQIPNTNKWSLTRDTKSIENNLGSASYVPQGRAATAHQRRSPPWKTRGVGSQRARTAVCEMWYWYGQSDNGLLAITRFCTQIMRVWRPSAPSHTNSTIFSPSLSRWQRAVTFFCVIAIPHLLRAACHAISFSCAVCFCTLKKFGIRHAWSAIYSLCLNISEFSPGRRPCISHISW
jgi:hypothetical protein